MTLTVVLGITFVLGGVLMLWSMLRITTAFGVLTVRSRWALFRRIVYSAMSISMFGLGVGHINGDYSEAPSQAIFQCMMLFGVMAFPLLRATGWISQDSFVVADGPSSEHAGR